MRPPIPMIPASWPPFYPLHVPVTGGVSRALDGEAQALGVPSFVLMEHASAGVASIAQSLLRGQVPQEGDTTEAGVASTPRPPARIVVLCGPGNNGGDGYGTARFLLSWGAACSVYRVSPTPPRAGGDAAHEAALLGHLVDVQDAWRKPQGLQDALRRADLVVDALFGVGLARDLEGPYAMWIEQVNAADALRLAVDVPSGLDADTGEVRGIAVRADVTATMAMPKTGLLAEGTGRAHAGRVVEIDIGLPGVVHTPHSA